MQLLLDSHAFLWALFEPEKLGKMAHAAISSPRNEVFVSAVSFWELSLKHSLGKLDFEGVDPEDLPGIAEKSGFKLLALDPKHSSQYHRLPSLGHKDPFDRMLVCQAISLKMPLVSKDPKMHPYEKHGLQLIW